jgi:aconitate hydratase
MASRPPASSHPDSFGARSVLTVEGREYEIFSLKAPSLVADHEVSRLPYSIKVILENLLRHEDSPHVSPDDIVAVAAWGANPEAHGQGAGDAAHEIALTPERVLMQDFTGVPGVVDLAAMRDALARLGGNASQVNPLVPVELVIDHSVIVERSGDSSSYDQNVSIEYERNIERYKLLRWAQGAFDGFRAVPPGTGICHQVNLEYLSRLVFATPDGRAFCDTLVGTDSHTTMVNGLGVLGWGVGGIEAEAAMLGQPLSMLLPPVVGLRISGELRPGTTATDVVLTVTELLRDHGVVGAFVECYGPGVGALPLETRATIGNMSPEYGATCTMFPIDQVTIDYMRFTGRDETHLALVEAYAKEQGLWHTADGIEPVYSEYATLDLGDVEPSLAGPSRPQDRVALAGAGDAFRVALDRTPRTSTEAPQAAPAPPPGGRGCRRGGDHQLHQHLEPPGHGRSGPAGQERRGARPAGQAVGQDLARPGLTGRYGLSRAGPTRGAPRAAGVLPRRLRLHHLHRQFGPTPERGQRTGAGRRSLRGLGALGQPELRGSDPPRRADELPGLAPAGRGLRVGRDHGHRPDRRPPGEDAEGKPVFLADIWPSEQEVSEAIRASLTSEMFRTRYGAVFEGDEYWAEVPVAGGETFSWQDDSTYVKNPPFFEGMTMTPTPVSDIEGARVLAMVGDSVTTDHISPAGSIGPDTPAGRYLAEHGVPRNDFNSYGARRGNHEVMMRGTFANVRLRNRLAPGTEGGYTLHLPEGSETSIYEAAMQYADEGVPLIVLAGREYGTGSSRDWAAKGTALLGVRAVIAQSFERIHRSNLVGMGVIPLQFYKGDSAESLALRGTETFSITGIDVLNEGELPKELNVVATADDGSTTEFRVVVRIDTPMEAEYFRHGGILRYVLRQLAG